MKKLILTSMLMPALSLGLYAAPVLADTVIVKNNNDASVKNVVITKADTGGNSADGGYADGSGGNGGSVSNSDDNNTGGNGGNGGWGGDGGLVVTGDATAKAKVINKVNTNDTTIDGCCQDPCHDPCDNPCHGDCDPCGCSDFVKVKNNNSARIKNIVVTKADTGGNSADGGSTGGGGAGDGGSVVNSDDDNTGGNGGDGGSGGWGGGVFTGSAYSSAKVVNIVNKNITRVNH